jgi:hypothetical protein
MDLSTLANLAEIIGVITVVGGLAFAVIQIAHFRQQRREIAAIELARSFQNPEFARALRLVLDLPEGITAEELRSRDARLQDAAMLVSLTLESIGIMVHRRLISLEMVWELMGAVILHAWDKLRPWAEDIREEQGRQKFDEWIQWLAGQLIQHEDLHAVAPAYERYREWVP